MSVGGPTRRRRWLAVVASALLLWVFLALVVVFEFWGYLPKTRLGWVLLLVFGPPSYLAAEWTSARLHPAEEGTGGRIFPARFSFARILVGVAVGLASVALVVVLFAWLGRAGSW